MIKEVHNNSAILCFVAFLLVTLWITVAASRRSKSAGEYFTAGGKIGAGQNAFAMAGEFLSAAALLGMTGAITLDGFDAILYSICVVVSWPLILFLLAGPIKRLGKFTLTDVIAWRLSKQPVRMAAALASLPIVLFYLITQLVAAGDLIQLIFGMPYWTAVVSVGGLMLFYVLFGGMLATTWVQIIKAILLLGGALILTGLLLARYGFDPFALFRAASKGYGLGVIAPRPTTGHAAWDTVSLALAMTVGALGMPQILSRFLTVSSPREAQKSAFYATVIVGVFHIMVLVLGYGCLVVVGRESVGAAGGGGNMAVPLLSRILAGEGFFGYISAVSFSTTLAVVAGLTLTASTTFAHDIWAGVIRHGNVDPANQARVAKFAATAIASVAVILALAFEHQNVAFMVGLSYAIAASANFPVLVLALFWRGLTTAGAVASIVVGAASAVLLICLSPTVQVGILHHTAQELANHWWFFPMKNPALITVPLSFFSAFIASAVFPEPSAKTKFDELRALSLGDAPSLEASGQRIGTAAAEVR
ncbi:cation:acetate symporter ActP [Paraburkholderia hospita]|uniref:Cation:acetate symporter ActP n=1 Tax=Paraburkholderia hospita TaxID=169430 RepID=A0ABP2Q0T1_9BURK|nr:cation/acetate symporter ActP [Paraburkholderia hospita]EIN02214.1 cation:acetate symporter ActP [Paraburkholderia hospita]OUL90104.1 cation acetate symporter [Paraburkholderia hospita]